MIKEYKKELKSKKKDATKWTPCTECPPWSGTYECQYDDGWTELMFYSGHPKHTWLRIGYKGNQDELIQPHFWRST